MSRRLWGGGSYDTLCFNRLLNGILPVLCVGASSFAFRQHPWHGEWYSFVIRMMFGEDDLRLKLLASGPIT